MDHRQSYMTQCLQTDAVCVLTAGAKTARLEMPRDLMPLRIPTIVFQETPLTDDFAVTRIVMDDKHGAARIGALVAKAGVRKAIILTKVKHECARIRKHRARPTRLRRKTTSVMAAKCHSSAPASQPPSVSALGNSNPKIGEAL